MPRLFLAALLIVCGATAGAQPKDEKLASLRNPEGRRASSHCLATLAQAGENDRCTGAGLDEKLIVISEDDFSRLTKERLPRRASADIQSRAMALAARLNSPQAIGVLAKAGRRGSEPVSGALFLVVRNPQIGDGLVTATDARVVAGELSGKASWVGRGATLALDNSFAASGSACCGPSSMCVTPPGTPNCDPQQGFCAPDSIGLSPNFPQGVGQRSDYGAPSVPVVLYGTSSGSYGVPGRRSARIGAAGRAAGLTTFETCVEVTNRSCTIAKPYCNLDEGTPSRTSDGSVDVAVGSTTCAGTGPTRSVYFNDVPEHCKYAYFADPPSECGGFAGDPFTAAATQNSFTPPICTRAQFAELPGFCKTGREREADRVLNNAYLAAQVCPANIPLGCTAQRCEYTGRGGDQSCITCTDGKCTQYVVHPKLDPTVADPVVAMVCKDTSGATVPCPTGPGGTGTGTGTGAGPTPPPGPTGYPNPAGCSGPLCPSSATNPPGGEPPDWGAVGTAVVDALKSAISAVGSFFAGLFSSSPDNAANPGASPGNGGPASRFADTGGLPIPPGKPDSGATGGGGKQPNGSFAKGGGSLGGLNPLRPGLGGANVTGDPVLPGDGSFALSHTDLAWQTPTAPFSFVRNYSSKSDERSFLGSNWTHNWDVRLITMRADDAPAWASPYCRNNSGITCVVLVDGAAGITLFFYDLRTELYLPQAGSNETLARTSTGGWALRTPDGQVRMFDADGDLTSVRDRFGNGATLAYEPTPLARAYDAFCAPAQLTTLGITKFDDRCAALAYFNVDGPKPGYGATAWALQVAANPLPATDPGFAGVEYGRQLLIHLLRNQAPVYPAWGLRRKRLASVSDDFNRAIRFTYYSAPAQTLPGGTTRYDFAQQPAEGLIASIAGPEGIRVEFTYARPANYPAALNEQFLVRVARTDVQAAGRLPVGAPRVMSFDYAWPGGAAPSYAAATASNVEARYYDYYKTFLGCWYQGVVCAGNFTPPRIAAGNPRAAAQDAANAYISSLADNIIRVTHTGRVESETRYDVDPNSVSFDAALAQRYGSATARAPTLPIERDRRNDNWQTQLPKSTYAYAYAGPDGQGGDRTDRFLPAQIAARYALETDRSVAGTPLFAALAAARSPDARLTCDYAAQQSARKLLPGYRESLNYYDVDAAQAHPNFSAPLLRSRLACEQLAAAQVEDPSHNDTLSTLIPDHTTAANNAYTLERLIGRRQATAANANRICAWARITDREGDISYVGLNYRGQALTEAMRIRNSPDYRYAERLVNADGNTVQWRQPVAGSRQWAASDGATRYWFDEIDPSAQSGADGWLPAFWARRMNLVRSETYASGAPLADVAESSGALTQRYGSFVKLAYEPLFNQLKSVEEGSLERIGVSRRIESVGLRRRDFLFDYQELAYGATDLKPVFDALRPWGFHWFEDSAGNYDYARISQWQMPLRFYAQDLNADSYQGFPFGTPAQRAKATVVALIETSVLAPTTPRSTFMSWAPHGQLAGLAGPDGDTAIFHYYDRDPAQAFGSASPPTRINATAAGSGHLAKFWVQTFTGRTIAPPTMPNAPCAALAGPYQWLLPATCSAASVRADLAALGLSTDVVDAIVSTTTPGSTDLWRSVSFAYDALGQTRYRWDGNARSAMRHNVDGLLLSSTDTLGTQTTRSYNVFGLEETRVVDDAAGKRLSALARAYDSADQVVGECIARGAGECVVAGQPVMNGTTMRYEYWPEGRLSRTIDPTGLTTSYEHDERKLPTRQLRSHPQYPALAARTLTYSYNSVGDITDLTRGASSGTQTISKHYAYDGLRRIRSYTDQRGYAWQLQYTTRDNIARVKRADQPYGANPPGAKSWESEFGYDAFGALTRRVDNGLEVARVARTPGGLTHTSSGAGRGETRTSYDLSSRAVWQSDPDGSVEVWTYGDDDRQVTHSEIRTSASGQALTLNSRATLDSEFRVTTQSASAGSVTRGWSFKRDGLGREVESTDPEGVVRRAVYNLAGWVTREELVTGSGVDVTTFDHDALGNLTLLTDPANVVTTLTYEPFHDLQSISVPGQSTVRKSFTYDDFGRLVRRRQGIGEVLYSYDRHNDLVLEELADNSGRTPLVEREFDDLGRISKATQRNASLAWLPQASRSVVRESTWDTQSRLASERIRIGGVLGSEVAYRWSLQPGNTWQMDFDRRVGGVLRTQRRSFDAAGRLARIEELGTTTAPAVTTQVDFSWLGDLPTGRTQMLAGRASPIRERVELSAFGETLGRDYWLIDTTAAGLPTTTSEGSQYCGGAWIAACAEPAYRSDERRYAAGRLALVEQRFGFPLMANGTRIAGTPPAAWQGFAYAAPGKLDRVWSSPAGSATALPPALQNYALTPAAVEQFATPATALRYSREPRGGSLAAIAPATGAPTWSLATPRGPGHQLTSVNVDGATRSITHDLSGNVQSDANGGYIFDSDGRLAAYLRSGIAQESYLYDDMGRLVGTLNAANAPAQRLTYDGAQMVSAHDGAGGLKWDAIWGPGVDYLLQWQEPGRTAVPLRDWRNSPVALWEVEQGRVGSLAEYTPEGRTSLRQADGSAQCVEGQGAGNACLVGGNLPFGFTSAWRSATSGLFNLRNRWYDARLGQFVSHDPEWYVDSFNLYEYAGGDPINTLDPYGTDAANPLGIPEFDPVKARAGKKHEVGAKIEAKWLSSRKEYYESSMTPPSERRQTEEGSTRGIQLQADRDEVVNQMDWTEHVVYDISEHTGGNKMAMAYTGADRWANELSTWERVSTGASGVFDAASLATTGTGLAKVAMVEYRGAQLSKYVVEGAAEAQAQKAAGRHVLELEAFNPAGQSVGKFTVHSVKGEGLGMFGHTEVIASELAWTKGWVRPGWEMKMTGYLQPCNNGVCRAVMHQLAAESRVGTFYRWGAKSEAWFVNGYGQWGKKAGAFFNGAALPNASKVPGWVTQSWMATQLQAPIASGLYGAKNIFGRGSK